MMSIYTEKIPQKKKKLRGKKKPAENVLGESLLEDDPAIVKLKVNVNYDA